MRGYLNNWLGYVAVAIAAAVPLCAANAAAVRDARVWAGPDHTRVVLDASGELNYRISRSGDRLTVDLGDSRVADGFAAPGARGLYHGMRHARVHGHLQLSATVAADSRLKSFVLKPAHGTDYRLVLDLYPGHGNRATQTGTAGSRGERVTPGRHAAPRHGSLASVQQAAALLDGERSVVVCIDAGHGGKDSGARGPDGTLEKNVTLAVARDLAAQIDRQPGMKAVLTRNGDYYIPLKQRYQIARENNADLFVSIHADSYVTDDARGSSVWVLSPRGKTSEAARWLADSENRADLIGGTTLDDKDDGLAKVLLDLQQGWAMQASDVVAGNVLKALARLGPTHRGYVERANFVVLRSPDVPSILVETAFISNPAEERKLRDPAHQKKLARAIMGGVKSYFESTPPQGTWFAAQAAAASGGARLASRGVRRGDGHVRGSRGVMLASNRSTRAESRGHDVHRVSRGESLGSIARHYGVSIGALKDANRIDSNTIRAGTVLTIPAS
ncbi:MAG: N-acetylmuramoyl-L-alanine amidase [Xanthomonadaceae bacterium]|nr:N-acetylmuramoyl-L-alanine amidase [Xanthomonadaceae bacterium]MDE3072027.1 N-acetylmuramoyl-L-alanine amidase [Pseudomonadota bacterium]